MSTWEPTFEDKVRHEKARLTGELSTAKYEKLCTNSDEPDRYEMQFKDGKIPYELLWLVDNVRDAIGQHLCFLSYPDDSIVAHLTVYPDGKMEATLSVPVGETVYSASIEFKGMLKKAVEKSLESKSKDKVKDAGKKASAERG